MPFDKAIIKWTQSKAVTLGLSYYGNVNWHLFTSFRKLVTNFDDKIAKSYLYPIWINTLIINLVTFAIAESRG